MFLKSLLATAEDFLGEKVDGTVLSVPDWFDQTAKDALLECASAAGITVLQLLEDAAAAASMIVNPQEVAAQGPDLPEDRTTLLIDMGASSLALTLLSIAKGLVYTHTSSHTALGGDDIDNRLIAWFAKEFTKKSKVPFVVPATNAADRRAEAKLRLAVELTKRTLSASPGAAACSVESLKDGYDYAGTINRLRFDVEMSSVYAKVNGAIDALLASAGKDHIQVDELVFVGGSTALPGLRDAVALKFPEEIKIGAYGEETSQVLAKGSAYQALLISSLPGTSDGASLKNGFERQTNHVHSTALEKTKAIGVKFSGSDVFVPIIKGGSALPTQHVERLIVNAQAVGGKTMGIEFWEAEESVKVDKPAAKEKSAKPSEDADDDDVDEDDEDEETKAKVYTTTNLLGSTTLAINDGTVHSTMIVSLIAEKDLSLKASVWEEEYPDVKASLESAAA
jgi:heat shock protein 1/8